MLREEVSIPYPLTIRASSIMGQRTIETNRLLLRPMEQADYNELFAIFSDPLVLDSFGLTTFSSAQMERWLARNLIHQLEHGYGLFSVIHKESGRLIGDCGLERMSIGEETVVELGYDFLSAFWNQGYATEAARSIRDFAFADLHIPRVISLIREANLGSRRVAEKTGMTLHDVIERNGATYHVYAIVAD
jgi:RimJ/RimL family protein N-acetyltransferase